MKDLLAKLDELHAKATTRPEDPDDESHILAAVGLQFEAAHHWPVVRAYIAALEKTAGYADSMLDFAAERGVEYDIARECLDRALCEVGIR
ncbi:MAG: hypothetical protein IPK60_23150 [Sandaracinaceae bacterium]|nr:hypothetical protein [Sandaracinaceae bacterium]